MEIDNFDIMFPTHAMYQTYNAKLPSKIGPHPFKQITYLSSGHLCFRSVWTASKKEAFQNRSDFL